MKSVSRISLFLMLVVFSTNNVNCKTKKDVNKNKIVKKAEQTKAKPITEKTNSSDLIDELYKNIKHQISDTERSMVTKSGGSPVYGEIKYDSLKKVLDDLKIKNTD